MNAAGLGTGKLTGRKLYKLLRQGKRRYRKGYGKKRSPIPDAVSIEQRPAVVDERSRVGDWEADLVLGKQGTGAIVTLVGRKSRIYLTKKVFSKDSAEVAAAIISMLSGYKDVCHTSHGRVRQGGVNSDPAFRSGNMSVKR
ncbi:IS30 family transposase [Candidatus Erwinia dacicola]|nr:IS30 family transposase [Candidatus Erwinia dacicola]